MGEFAHRKVLNSKAEKRACADASLPVSTGPWKGISCGYWFDMLDLFRNEIQGGLGELANAAVTDKHVW